MIRKTNTGFIDDEIKIKKYSEGLSKDTETVLGHPLRASGGQAEQFQKGNHKDGQTSEGDPGEASVTRGGIRLFAWVSAVQSVIL